MNKAAFSLSLDTIYSFFFFFYHFKQNHSSRFNTELVSMDANFIK